MPGFVLGMYFLPAQGRFREIAHGRSLPQVSPSAVFVLSMAGGGHGVQRADPTGTKSMPRRVRQGAGLDVHAPSRSPRRRCPPACRRRGLASLRANDGAYSNSGMQSGSGTLLGCHCRSRGNRADIMSEMLVPWLFGSRLKGLHAAASRINFKARGRPAVVFARGDRLKEATGQVTITS